MKKLLLFLFTLLLLLGATAALADNMSGRPYGNFNYAQGKNNTAIIVYYNGSDTELVIPDSMDGRRVTGIWDYAFCNCKMLTSVVVPEDVTYIGNDAFSMCSFLTSITLPEGLQSIGNNAFSQCSKLTGIVIPDSVTTLGTNPFAECPALVSITVSPEHPTLEIIDGVLFDKAEKCLICYPSSLTSDNYAVPEGTRVIGEKAFYRCSVLTDVSLPDSVTVIGEEAFYRCSALNGILLPDSVTAIGENAFQACKVLTVTVSPDSYAMRYCVENEIPYVFSETGN